VDRELAKTNPANKPKRENCRTDVFKLIVQDESEQTSPFVSSILLYNLLMTMCLPVLEERASTALIKGIPTVLREVWVRSQTEISTCTVCASSFDRLQTGTDSQCPVCCNSKELHFVFICVLLN